MMNNQYMYSNDEVQLITFKNQKKIFHEIVILLIIK